MIRCHHCKLEIENLENINVCGEEISKGLQIFRCDPCQYIASNVGVSISFPDLSTESIVSFGKGWRAAMFVYNKKLINIYNQKRTNEHREKKDDYK